VFTWSSETTQYVGTFCAECGRDHEKCIAKLRASQEHALVINIAP
jgi:hypothetical protein